jgi:hypothetical protein
MLKAKIRFDELLERRASRLSKQTNYKKKEEVDVARTPNLTFSPDYLAALVCAAASGLLPGVVLSSTS